jgi:hypothetical protein
MQEQTKAELSLEVPTCGTWARLLTLQDANDTSAFEADHQKGFREILPRLVFYVRNWGSG